MQLPGVSRKEGRRFADSRCVQEGESVLTALPGVSRKATICSFPVCPGRIVDSVQRLGISRKGTRSGRR